MLLEFLEVAIHTILCVPPLWVPCAAARLTREPTCGLRYHRSVYPSSLFERRRKYNVAVQMSRHPELNDYVFEVWPAVLVCVPVLARADSCCPCAAAGPENCSPHVHQGVVRHPPHASVVGLCVTHVRFLNAQGQIERVDVVIMGARGVPDERFMFEVRLCTCRWLAALGGGGRGHTAVPVKSEHIDTCAFGRTCGAECPA